MRSLAAALVAAAIFPAAANATPITLAVNTTTTLRAAVARANLDGANSYTIALAAGAYVDPNLHVGRSMTLDAVVDGTVTLLGSSTLPNRKGLILADGIGTHLTVDGIKFQGAHINNLDGGNGAGIRDQVSGIGSGLTVTDSLFLNNQEGILTGGSAGLERVVIQRSAFRGNGNASKNTGQEHGIYVNSAASVVIDGSVFCGQVGAGHNIKVRSAATTITNTQSYEGTSGGGCTNAGNASRGIDIPNAGVASLANVDLYQGAASPNWGMLSFGVEGVKYAANSLTMRDVDFVSTRGGVAINWAAGTSPCLYDPATSFTGVTVSSPTGVCHDPPLGPAVADLGTGAPVAVPEPGSLALLAGALAGLALRWCRFGRRAA